jgi:3-oxoacyl-[acyl-carrier-protein] synthase-1
LGKVALADLQSRVPLSHDSLRSTGIFLNLSDQFYADSTVGSWAEVDGRLPSTVWAEQCEQLIPRLLKASNLENIPQNHKIYFGGHTGFVQAIQEAAALLRAGHFDHCLVGGIDSCIEPRFLSAAATKGVLKTSANPVGFVPGEAAAFVLLDRTTEARSRKGGPAGFLMGTSLVSNCRDRLSDDKPDGVGLARAIDDVLRASHKKLASIISDLNGDDYRAREWGNALPRLRPKHSVAKAPMCIPALAFGEIGAASAPVGLCLGIAAQQRGWIPDGLIMEWLSADKGSRAALCFASVDGAQRG